MARSRSREGNIEAPTFRQPRRVGLLSRPKQGSLECGVQPARDGGYLLVTKLSERCQWPVVLEDAVPSIVLVKHNADRRIQRGRELMPDHERGRDGIANIVLERVTRLASDLQYRAMITDLEN